MDTYKTRLEMIKKLNKTTNIDNNPMFSKEWLISHIMKTDDEIKKAKYDLIYIYEKRKRIAKKILQA